MFWIKAANLLDDQRRIVRVGFENGPRGFDDVWVEYDSAHAPHDPFGRPLSVERLQCKWHATPGTFTHQDLPKPEFINATGTSFLQRALAAHRADAAAGLQSRLALVTNHWIDKSDVLYGMLRMKGLSLDLPKLFDGKGRSDAAKVRALWRDHLKLGSDDELQTLVACLSFNLTTDSLYQQRERLDEACRSFGLVRPPLSAAATIYDTNIYEWVGQGRIEFDRDSFRAKCEQEGLLAPKGPSMVAYGVKSFEHAFDRLEDRCAAVLNLVPAFNDRQIQNIRAWRGSLLPQLQQFLRGIPAPDGRIRLAMDAHATLAFAAGSILNTKSGRLVDLEQRSPNLTVWSPDDAAPRASWPTWNLQESSEPSGQDILCGVGLSRPVAADVRGFAAAEGLSPALSIFAELPSGPSQKSVLCGAHAAALADSLATHLQTLRTAKNLGSARLHLFMAAPNGFSFEFGRHAAALGPLTLYEHDFERRNGVGYSASLSLP